MTRRLAQTADNQALTYGTTAVSLRAGRRTCLCVLAAAQLVTHSECGVGRRHPPMFAHAILCPGGFADSFPEVTDAVQPIWDRNDRGGGSNRCAYRRMWQWVSHHPGALAAGASGQEGDVVHRDQQCGG